MKLEDTREALIADVKKAYERLIIAKEHFDFADNMPSIDYFTHKISTAEARYEQCLKELKEYEYWLRKMKDVEMVSKVSS